MPDSIDYNDAGMVDYVQPSNPDQYVVGARVGQEWCNSTTGIIWTCTDATFGAQRWEACNGQVVSAISDFTHPDLLAAWTMDNISGSTLVDESSNGNNATINGAIQVSGLVGNALSFDGSDEVTRGRIETGTTFTVSTWAKFDNVVDFQQLIGQRSGNPTPADWILLYNGSAFRFAVWNTVGTAFTIGAGFIPTVGQWHHLVGVVRADQSIELWVDGALSDSSTYTGTLSQTATVLDIGNGNGWASVTDSAALSGDLEQARIFTKDLNAAEIGDLYNTGAGI